MALALQNYSWLIRKKSNPLLFHIIAWLIFIFYELASVFFVNGTLSGIGRAFVYYILYISIFYFHARIALPFAFGRLKRPHVACLVLIVPELVACILLKCLVDRYIESYKLQLNDLRFVSKYLFLSAWRCVYFIGLGTVYWLIRRMLNYRAEIASSEKELAEVRYAFLQQQISPHFLFNTLNFVYNSVYKLSPVASECILQLSDVMRYSLESNDAAEIDLYLELEQIQNLLSLNRLRYDHELYLIEEIDGDPEGVKIIPLVLLTLVENVFKHGKLTDEANPARISISVNPQRILTFETRNLKKRQRDGQKTPGIGLRNTIKRLDFAYPGRYKLDITDQETYYRLELSMQL
ncbi:MAG: sensor histidine kinase [Sphingobacteriales bacterium]